MIKEKLQVLIAATKTDKFIGGASKKVQKDNECYEAYEREQRRLCHNKYKNYSYGI